MGRKCTQTVLVIFNVICFIIGGIILGIGIWTAVDRVFLSEIIGTYLYSAASYLLIATGAVILIVSFLGGFGACTQIRYILISYFALLVFLFLCLVISAILAVVFRGEIETTMKTTMRDTLLNKYGYDIYNNDENAAVTKSWDETQIRLECCAVDESMDWDYRVYRQSNWFMETQRETYSEERLFVPASCCVKVSILSSERYQNKGQCQRPIFPIPPRGDASFGDNSAFNSQGCFSRGYDLVMDQAGILLAIAFTFAACLVLGMVLSICLYRYIPNRDVPVGDDDYDDKL